MRANVLVLLCSVLCVCGVEGLGLPPLAPPPPPLQPPPHHVDPSAPPLPPPVLPLDEDEPPPPEEEDDDEDQDTNTTTFGMFLGAPCEFTCNSKLHHVFCDPITGHCECEKKFPVKLGPSKGCAKPKSLGEQCFYRQTCKYMDSHASCIQINHNAICQCETGYHSVTYNRPSRKVFCTEDMALLTSDVHTLLGVCSGIALLAGLLCLVLHLYTRGRIQHTFPPGHFADASLSPPVLFTNETGVPLTLQGRPSSRSSQRSVVSRRSSPSPMGPSSRAGAARAAAILLISCHMPERRTLSLPAAGSRRPSLTSLQSSTSSVRSFSMRRFEREREQKERRQQMQMRLAQLHANMGGDSSSTTLRNATSPRTPNSTDGLLPAVNEARELSLSQFPLMDECDSPSIEGIIGPCSSSGTSY